MTFVPSEVVVTATGALNEEIKKELNIPDPDSIDAAQAIAKAKLNENTQGND